MSKTKIGLNPDQISTKWARRLKGSVVDIQTGIDGVTESPAEKAVAKQEKMLANLTKSVNDGVWANQLKKVSLSDWKQKTKEKVAQRLPGGVDAAMPKRKRFDSWMTNTINEILPTIASMADLTLEDNIARATAMIRHMAENKYKKS